MTVTECKFEFLEDDSEIKGAKIWKVEAIHVTTTGNKRKYTLSEMELGARSLSFRPLNRNHDHSRWLDSPANTTLFMEFDRKKLAVVGKMRIVEPDVNALIESGKIKKLSIEQIPTKGETCNNLVCEQHGVAFTAMALLDSGITPGDSKAEIKNESMQNNFDTLENLIVSNAQRECKDCNDFVACHECKHKVEANDKCIGNAIDEIKKAHPDWSKEKVLAVAISKCNANNSNEEAWAYYRRFENLVPE